jgi:alpha-ketoglutarate-dependent taurine dioxygenase
MLTQAIAGPRAWTAKSVDEPQSWYYPLPEDWWPAFEAVRESNRKTPRPLFETRLPEGARNPFIAALNPVRAALETGRGFAIVQPPPGKVSPQDDLRLLYWLVGLGLGRPVEQNVQGALLYNVRDTGQDLSKGARFSVTNYESSFHTDNSFGTEIVDYVGLLCLQIAKSGGRSQVVSGYAVHDELLARNRDALEILKQPFHVDRRGGVRAGESPTIQFPVIASNQTELVFRYLRYWIEVGHEKAGQPLTEDQVAALNVLDEVLNRRDLRAEFDLRPGDMYFINNRWILHNRTAFEDYTEPERRRHLVRLWLQAPSLGS